MASGKKRKSLNISHEDIVLIEDEEHATISGEYNRLSTSSNTSFTGNLSPIDETSSSSDSTIVSDNDYPSPTYGLYHSDENDAINAQGQPPGFPPGLRDSSNTIHSNNQVSSGQGFGFDGQPFLGRILQSDNSHPTQNLSNPLLQRQLLPNLSNFGAESEFLHALCFNEDQTSDPENLPGQVGSAKNTNLQDGQQNQAAGQFGKYSEDNSTHRVPQSTQMATRNQQSSPQSETNNTLSQNLGLQHHSLPSSSTFGNGTLQTAAHIGSQGIMLTVIPGVNVLSQTGIFRSAPSHKSRDAKTSANQSRKKRDCPHNPTCSSQIQFRFSARHHPEESHPFEYRNHQTGPFESFEHALDFLRKQMDTVHGICATNAYGPFQNGRLHLEMKCGTNTRYPFTAYIELEAQEWQITKAGTCRLAAKQWYVVELVKHHVYDTSTTVPSGGEPDP
ncbi:uncharacterized protein BCR38DRAFT_446698, partial [Pseudomassariella vexata]